ncbi:hypothetical protein WEN_03065 [Mycoplasma wenyonii str. Massachusetts]|uniref:Uncharacterized protein n=1 Tax=Mycoplasma wenyonii (strain Massachusetts) TaxID=1197325 RepID=I6YM65_MYCWM|nr:hypothetical protein [Mycoplasma wenyonii]AFN65394.1 hypothetical protein WEN_03065 [Mycoplasma wenyonii str. Massachusetts]
MRKQPIISSELYKQLHAKKGKSAEVIEDFEIIFAEELEKERREQKMEKESNNTCKERNPTVLTQADLLRRLHATANRYQELFHKYMDKKLEEYELREFLELERKRTLWQRKCEEYDKEQETLFLETKSP